MARREREIGPCEVTCLACGWVSYAVTRAEAESEVARMREYLATLSAEDRRGWSEEGPSVEKYVCMGCGGREFRPARAEDCPDGATTNPVVWEG
ncbi:hypothetical protein FV232_09730 [Methylobacterium sp. WL30]|uniref:hypothetical protein n=1 Tax=unclassified Methylobacterium TaxID=2615210 RepID=UPI0011C9F846|nr:MULTISPECIES: hypothetical protein [unclassified Methylobacterium]TXN41262.1 hypothetical protein FV225_03050 [Methylobacterium sp. WL93]TXN50947.1 hypothetical protein FV227_09805 [Methylobacterium sp. WL119]TXN68164.1 hypothetical protein FV232_09730 [Methylobacterium sp. WL30]TXN69156.1 hypothetical protein FV228_12960 [Methylobacterium sp. WL18]